MRLRLLPFATILASSLLALPFPGGECGAVALVQGETPPPFTLQGLDGRETSIGEFRGRPVVLAFFSTWCSRCAEELVFLRDSLSGGGSPEGGGGAVSGGGATEPAVLLVNQDGEGQVSPGKIAGFRDRLSLPFPVFIDRGLALWGLFGISSLPTTVVLGGDGRVLHVESGFTAGTAERLRVLFEGFGRKGRDLGERGGASAGKCASAGHITGGREGGSR